MVVAGVKYHLKNKWNRHDETHRCLWALWQNPPVDETFYSPGGGLGAFTFSCSFHIKQIKSGLSFWIIILLVVTGYAKPYIHYNDDVKACYRWHHSPEDPKSPKRKIQELKVSQKDNLAILHLKTTLIFSTLLLRKTRLNTMPASPIKISDSAYWKILLSADAQLDFIKAEILLQWALIQIKFDENGRRSGCLQCLWLLEANQKIVPGFKENNKKSIHSPCIGLNRCQSGLESLSVWRDLFSRVEKKRTTGRLCYNWQNLPLQRRSSCNLYLYLLSIQRGRGSGSIQSVCT